MGGNMCLADLVGDLDIADTYPKYMRTTWAAIDHELQDVLKKRLEYANPNVILITTLFDQYTSNMLHALREEPFGIGKQIESINIDKDFTSITVKFKGPIQWTIR